MDGHYNANFAARNLPISSKREKKNKYDKMNRQKNPIVFRSGIQLAAVQVVITLA